MITNFCLILFTIDENSIQAGGMYTKCKSMFASLQIFSTLMRK